jgi:ABC-type dipeptide/oligopeptide/nickel transport system ATPase subunit
VTFTFQPAKREATPCMLGIVGPSGTGKTFSALRLAKGMRKVVGGEVAVIDTEGRRALYYADQFKFLHLDFGPPFGSLRYLEAVQEAIKAGAKTIIVDSMSHEHEGQGGLLEEYDRMVQELAAKWKTSPDKASMSAWAHVKAPHRRMINTFLQLQCNMIFCFRAQEKVKVIRGGEPTPRGYQPITDEKFIYEMLASFLLLPGSNGVPVWQGEKEQQALMKLPGQFKELFARRDVQLSEEIGETIALWGAGLRKKEPVPTRQPGEEG